MPKQNRKPGIHLHTSVRYSGAKGKNKTTEYYWILIARNGKTIARSSETYKRKGSAVRSIEIASFIMSGQIPMFYYDHTTGGTGVEEVEF